MINRPKLVCVDLATNRQNFTEIHWLLFWLTL